MIVNLVRCLVHNGVIVFGLKIIHYEISDRYFAILRHQQINGLIQIATIVQKLLPHKYKAKKSMFNTSKILSLPHSIL